MSSGLASATGMRCPNSVTKRLHCALQDVAGRIRFGPHNPRRLAKNHKPTTGPSQAAGCRQCLPVLSWQHQHSPSHRSASPQPAQLREPARTCERLSSPCCINELLSDTVHRFIQIIGLLQRERLRRYMPPAEAPQQMAKQQLASSC